MRIFEQADTSTTAPCGAIYSWILDGIKHNSAYGRRLKHRGWKWVSGRPGSFVTNDAVAAADQAAAACCDIKTNGSHAAIGAPALLCDPTTV